MMAGFEMPSFIFGGNETSTPESVKRKRRIAEAMQAQLAGPVDNGWEGMTRIAQALVAKKYGYDADQADAAGVASSKALYDALLANPDAAMSDYAAAMGDPWLQQDAGKAAIVQSLMNREVQQSDPGYQLEQKINQAQLDALLAPKPVEMREINGQLIDPETYDVLGDYRTVPEPEPYTLGGGQVRFDPANNPVATGPEMQPETIINTGDNSSKFQGAMDEAAATRMSEIIKSGDGAALFMGDLKALTDIGRNIDTGQGAAITKALGPYAEMVGIDIEGLGEMQAFDGIVSRMAPQMRIPGSGASSDFDAQQFLKSLPALARTPEGNQLINETFQGIQQHKMAAAEYARQASQGLLTWQEADKAIAALGDPYTAFKDTQAAAGPVAGVGGVNGIQEVPNFPGVTIEWIAP